MESLIAGAFGLAFVGVSVVAAWSIHPGLGVLAILGWMVLGSAA